MLKQMCKSSDSLVLIVRAYEVSQIDADYWRFPYRNNCQIKFIAKSVCYYRDIFCQIYHFHLNYYSYQRTKANKSEKYYKICKKNFIISEIIANLKFI
jgi:hypothetical protein